MSSRIGSEPNLEFYMNKRKSEPNGDFIENILSWKGDYEKLSKNCTYMQWLFPNRTAGKNEYASPITEMEAEIIRECPETKNRVKRAFEMMLDFWGMEFVEPRSFKLSANADERLKYHNVWGSNSFLHITRILLALKELGYKELLFPWMKFLAELIYQEKKLDEAESSFEEFWMETLDEADSIELMAIVDTFRS